MQPEEAIEIDGRVFGAVGLGDRQTRPQVVLTLFAEGDHHVESVHRTALENSD
jgi:hypothetical protein